MRCCSPRGHTLLEITLALPLASMLVLGAGSAIYIASKAATQDSGRRDRMDEKRITWRLASDLREAISFGQRSPNAVEFLVPDRDGDGILDSLRYEWSGTPGDPLYHRVNASANETLLPSVNHFLLEYVTKTPTPAPYGDEQARLISHDYAPGGFVGEFRIDSSQACAQFIKPSLPAGASTWSLNRVRIMARATSTPDGTVRVRIVTATASDKPGTTVLSSTTFRESALGTGMAWLDVDIPPVENLLPSQGVCLVLKYEAGTGGVAYVGFQGNGSPMTAGTHWMMSFDGGSNWTTPGNNFDMRFYAYGSYDVQAGQSNYLTAVRGTLQGSAAALPSQFVAPVLNGPEVY